MRWMSQPEGRAAAGDAEGAGIVPLTYINDGSERPC
jgi:hypothetical protein